MSAICWAVMVAAGQGSRMGLSYNKALMPLMGKPAEVVYPNGKVAMRGTLVGMDVWGRATIRNEFGVHTVGRD